MLVAIEENKETDTFAYHSPKSVIILLKGRSLDDIM